jgi:cellobiose transport system substrate-binding protein
VLSKPQLFNDLSKIGPQDANKDRWLSWKYDAAKAKDGTLIGYGTDIGPLAMCYRKDLLQAAGLPSDPEAVKALFTTWDAYFAAGDTYVQKTGKAWFDSDSQIFNAMVNQLDTGYIGNDDKLAIESNSGIKSSWDKVTAAGKRGQTAKLVAFSNEWNSGFKAGAFATKTCPSWMTGVVKKQSGPENQGKWAVTDAFPGGGGNWGGSYLTVPIQSPQPEEAAKLAAWLTAPEQQVKVFKKIGSFPSTLDAYNDPQVKSQVNAYFNKAPVGQIFIDRARNVILKQHKGPRDGEINQIFSAALARVDDGKQSPDAAWAQALDQAEKVADTRVGN